MKLSHFFIPHPQTHKKAHLLSMKALAIYILLFLVLHVGFTAINNFSPGVLGVNSQIDQQELIKLTNVEREKKGLSTLSENEKLTKAAYEKAKNMFEEDYWAHYSPSGKDPWGFISGAGYKFSYAGENLARNFYTSKETVDAWMASPTHKANILNNNYQEIGIAVLEGTLKGQKTTLIVQEFGTPVNYIAEVSQVPDSLTRTDNLAVPGEFTLGQSLGSTNIDSFMITKSLGFGILALISLLIIVDLVIIKKRAVVNLSSRHLPHLAMLSAAAGLVFNMRGGSVL